MQRRGDDTTLTGVIRAGVTPEQRPKGGEGESPQGRASGRRAQRAQPVPVPVPEAGVSPDQRGCRGVRSRGQE